MLYLLLPFVVLVYQSNAPHGKEFLNGSSEQIEMAPRGFKNDETSIYIILNGEAIIVFDCQWVCT